MGNNDENLHEGYQWQSKLLKVLEDASPNKGGGAVGKASGNS